MCVTLAVDPWRPQVSLSPLNMHALLMALKNTFRKTFFFLSPPYLIQYETRYWANMLRIGSKSGVCDERVELKVGRVNVTRDGYEVGCR